MLIDILPKEERKDFYDREKEINQLESFYSPITLILGLRRTGKSSLIKIALNELKKPFIYIDMRKFEEKEVVTYKDFIIELEKEINKLVNKHKNLIEILKRIEGITIMGNQIKFSWKKNNKVSITSFFEILNDWAEDKVIISIDEAQILRKAKGINLLPILAYTYDNLKKIKIILSGSEMGLLYSYLKVDDPSKPLFGRVISEIYLNPFSKELAIDFLKKGFEEVKVKFDKFEEVYENIGGIPGWLTYFGYNYYRTLDFDKSLKMALESAKKLIISEFENFLLDKYIARKRYYTIMRTVSSCARWSDIKRRLEDEIGHKINDSEIHNYLNQLQRSSWIIKENEKYCPAEKLIGYAFYKFY